MHIKRGPFAQKIALVLCFCLPSIVEAQSQQTFGPAANGVRIGIFIKMVELNGDWHPFLHVVTENTSNHSQNLLPSTTWDTVAIVDSSGHLVADRAPCPIGGNGEIPQKPQTFTLASGAQRVEDDAFDLKCFITKPGSYSVTLTSKIYPVGDIGLSNPLATLKSNTINVTMP
jgi:hypothetical protein